MLNASNLPALFAECAEPEADGILMVLVADDFEPRRVGPADGFWRLTPDPDLFHVHPADYAKIVGATNAEPVGALLIGGKTHKIEGSRDDTGKRWLVLETL